MVRHLGNKFQDKEFISTDIFTANSLWLRVDIFTLWIPESAVWQIMTQFSQMQTIKPYVLWVHFNITLHAVSSFHLGGFQKECEPKREE
jgi:hypothetical protein